MSEAFNALKERDLHSICNTYARYPLAISKAQGVHLYDSEGKEYVDLLAGIAVSNLGHANQEILQALVEQWNTVDHVSNLFHQEWQIELAEQLLGTCDADKVFFCNSGAEANEAALKLARRYMHTVAGRDAHEIITLDGSFHGRTLATLTATGQAKVKEGFDPLPEGFKTVPFMDMDALRDAISDKTAAIMVELIQGERGVRPLSQGYVDELVALCKEKQILLIVDEVQTGLGRTGKYWAHQHYGITPDIFTTAKPLANGLPMGAMFAREDIAKAFSFGSHGTTFGGGPIVCAVAKKVLEIMERDQICEHAAKTGEYALSLFADIQKRHPEKVAEVRGLGLIMAVELSFPGQEIWEKLLEAGFICNLTQGNILRLLPPLIIDKTELERFAKELEALLA
ncbi:aspartate aminotransferase family protein [Desulfobaculum bizertense]|uniref:Acetylornithine aminotransferase n=1 Tax=Desulfobaculum bizertense DSM 18034 TaxID=1121442 RepID=A0A1T4W7J6_9BACT|nr:aspartate aminotransferase family protein [Desulfobaculum bizertense]UIJ39140.1 aspartate aminotransferase family protein [Desulfobaculum bizertense]SKA73240.1 acetylornithine aminotransferase [Desulfobaculum bizertense DSM 18034]